MCSKSQCPPKHINMLRIHWCWQFACLNSWWPRPNPNPKLTPMGFLHNNRIFPYILQRNENRVDTKSLQSPKHIDLLQICLQLPNPKPKLVCRRMGFAHEFYQDLQIGRGQKISTLLCAIPMHYECLRNLHFALRIHADITLTLSGFAPSGIFTWLLPGKMVRHLGRAWKVSTLLSIPMP